MGTWFDIEEDAMTDTWNRDDLFHEVTNVGAGNAATALSELLMTKVHMGLPRSTRTTSADLIADLPTDKPIAVTIIGVVGDLDGHIVSIFGPADAYGPILGVGDDDLDSAFGEIGNIVSAKFLVAVTELTGHFAEVTPPKVARPFVPELGSIIDDLATETPMTCILSPLHLDGSNIDAHIAFVPSAPTVELLGGLL